MISRAQKNKELNKEINYEKTINLSKRLLKLLFIIILIFSAFFLYAYFIGIKGIKTNEFVIKDDYIPTSFNGVKILHFSDILYDHAINSENLNSLLDEIKRVNPDITVFTGNLINNNYNLNESDIKNIHEFMKNIPYKIGKYAIKGNLDTNNFDLIMDNTEFTVLDNEVLEIYNGSNESINIYGININNNEKINIDNDKYTISLINNYDMHEKYITQSNLIFAGNNLGGEIKIFGIPLLTDNKYNKDYYEENDSKIFISNGLGSPHHMRFMNHPSINVYRLISYN